MEISNSKVFSSKVNDDANFVPALLESLSLIKIIDWGKLAHRKNQDH